MSRIKVAFVLPSLHGGGAERAAVKLLNALPHDSFDLTLYLFERTGAYLDEVGRHVRLVVGSAGGRVGRFAELRRFVASEPLDVVVSFLSHFVVYAAVRAARRDTRFVISQQTPVSAFLSDADYHWRRPADRAIFTTAARAVYPRADLIVAASTGVADDLVAHFGVSPHRLAIVPNAVDVEDVERKATEPLPFPRPPIVPLIVTAGRLADAKNLPLLVESLRLLRRRGRFHAWILGQGELERDLRARLHAADLDADVELLGFQSNPWKFMAAADVFVLTSRYEGFGNVLIEAMASGTPVVATASYGTRDIVQHERTGLLVEPHDAERVAEALERIISDVPLRLQFAATGRERAREFGIGPVTRAFGAAMERSLNRRREAAA